MQECHQLFIEVQMQGVFADGKTFVDSIAKRDPALIREQYEVERQRPDFSLRHFVLDNFHLPEDAASDFRPDPQHDVLQNIEALWPHLTRRARAPADVRERDSLLSLPDHYVVPGGRFREIYYWDSYFTLLGLLDGGHRPLAESMVRNLAYLIDHHDHVPNGNRSYFLSRSHPPVFYKMVEATAVDTAAQAFLRYLPQLKREHAYWMAGSDTLDRGEAVRHVVRLPDGALLNRYWDERDSPRDEMYKDDVLTALHSPRPHGELFRDIRAAAESGWDFSSRWNADPHDLGTIETTAILPVDLNCLLHGLESAISIGCAEGGDETGRLIYQAKAYARQAAIDRYFWSEALGHYVDYHWVRRRQLSALTVATVLPLFTGVASQDQAEKVAASVSGGLLMPYGMATTTVRSGQQWDLPNGWAPHHWMAVEGLTRYGCTALAREIAVRWIGTVDRIYRETGKLLEKYDVTALQAGGGGEYPTQDGFGWTNGVTATLMKRYPNALAQAGRIEPFSVGDTVQPEGPSAPVPTPPPMLPGSLAAHLVPPSPVAVPSVGL